MIRVYRIPFSTNVERVALALAHKGLEAEWIDVDPADRSVVRDLSGQELVPVLEVDGRVLADSPQILEYLEARHPDPPLLPRGEARREEVRVFCDWFNETWKRPPNRIAIGRGTDADEAALRGSLDRFEALLSGRDHLLGDELTLADVTAFPFLKYGLLRDPADDEPFHTVLADRLALGDGYPRLAAWIRRVDARPRA